MMVVCLALIDVHSSTLFRGEVRHRLQDILVVSFELWYLYYMVDCRPIRISKEAFHAAHCAFETQSWHETWLRQPHLQWKS